MPGFRTIILAMARIIFVFLMVNCGRFSGMKRSIKWMYKPYGPKMCGELCEDSSFSFHYIVENLSCYRDFRNQTIKEIYTSDDLSACVERNISKAVPMGQDVCKASTGDYSSKAHLQNMESHIRYIPNMTLHQACEKGKLGMVKYILLNRLEGVNHRQDKSGKTPIMTAALNRQVAVFDFLFRRDCDLLAVDNNKNTVLHLACSGGNTDIVKKLLNTGKYNQVQRNIDGWTPVMSAAFFGHIETLALLVSENFSMKVLSSNGNNLLHVACISGHVDVVKYILSRDIVDINSRGHKRRTPVMIAAVHHRRELFHFLVCSGSNLELLDVEKNNILHLACIGGQIGITKYILSLDVFDINCRNAMERTPVMFASMKGHREVFELLVTEGCNLKTVDKQQTNILHAACIGGQVNMVEYILSLQILSIESGGYNGRTPVLLAAESGQKEVFDFLISKGCNVQAVDEDANNALHVACLGGDADMVSYILSRGTFDIDVRGSFGYTPAMVAAYYGEIRVLKLLLTKGCDLKAVNKQGYNILHIACIGGETDIVNYILSLNTFNTETRGRNGQTPALIAADYGEGRVLKLLVSKGCDLKAEDNEGKNILHAACLGGHVNIVKYLLALNDVRGLERKENKHGRTPVQEAKRKGHRAVVRLLG